MPETEAPGAQEEHEAHEAQEAREVLGVQEALGREAP